MRMVRLLGILIAACLVAVGHAHAQAEPPAGAPAAPAKEQYALPSIAAKKWTGDFDGMVKRRVIRVLTSIRRRITASIGERSAAWSMIFSGSSRTFSTRSSRPNTPGCTSLFVPVARDELIPGLLDGRGDIAAANLTITPERLKQVDFANPTGQNVSLWWFIIIFLRMPDHVEKLRL